MTAAGIHWQVVLEILVYTVRMMTWHTKFEDVQWSACLQGAERQDEAYVGGTCVQHYGGTSGVGVLIWVLCSMIFALTAGGALLWLQQAGYLTWDKIRSKFSRRDNALNEGLYHELSMDTGF